MNHSEIPSWLSAFLGPGRDYPTAQHLAKATGVSAKTINQLASTSRASPDTLIKIADAVGTPRVDILMMTGWLRQQDLTQHRTGSFSLLKPHNAPLMAFDLEIATNISGNVPMPPDPPLGITCAAVWAENQPEPLLAWGGRDAGDHGPRMSRKEAKELLHEIWHMAQTHRLATWNGTGFDLPVLGSEAGDMATARQLALSHTDMMLHVLAEKGWPIGLNTAAKGMSLPGKQEGTAGEDVPRLWTEGYHQQVINYCSQDARTTLDIAVTAEMQRQLTWHSRSGRPQTLSLHNGWLTVPQALELPIPDTPWIKDPVQRDTFTSWLYA